MAMFDKVCDIMWMGTVTVGTPRKESQAKEVGVGRGPGQSPSFNLPENVNDPPIHPQILL